MEQTGEGEETNRIGERFNKTLQRAGRDEGFG